MKLLSYFYPDGVCDFYATLTWGRDMSNSLQFIILGWSDMIDKIIFVEIFGLPILMLDERSFLPFNHINFPTMIVTLCNKGHSSYIVIYHLEMHLDYWFIDQVLGQSSYPIDMLLSIET